MIKNQSDFSNILIVWYLQNKRDLPWRNESQPYYIWLSEIMLQQTRVAQGLPYYLKFIKAFPTIADLANASEEYVLKLWQGLGYYSRARNLHYTAKEITFNRNSEFPDTYKELLELKGVGDYTASAIASICYNEPTAVVDGNVYRVLSRVFGIETPINSSSGVKIFKDLAQELIDAERPGTFNQAVMEFGARYCIPQKPDCENCVFSDRCEAKRTGSVSKLPVKIRKQKIKHRHFNYLVILSDKQEATVLQQRRHKGIWQSLYEFPLIETDSEVGESEIAERAEFKAYWGKNGTKELLLFNESPIIHKLSHQHLHTKFWVVKTAEQLPEPVPISEINNYPVPVLIENFISEFSPFQN
ncbi:MAG: A/G-specific adenine glycosylase [Bacteroidia bacterium]|nr:A/G-specific adenine glycosylase [Bacteroidia bacterium]NNF30449.1 A/G-specific adenine glycosylase [Flavobacteriaceae bacterium]MBT8275650.1 A/G-specific adenine glycosylase [Bacteroidia bacterium]NNJ82682.1 A/G-specific adenine glycosylase [Flavobacteriaceae bacterium]NNK54293.1 A/G-specific adenine glycosylase [Flavobacteriaceae bacterium]